MVTIIDDIAKRKKSHPVTTLYHIPPTFGPGSSIFFMTEDMKPGCFQESLVQDVRYDSKCIVLYLARNPAGDKSRKITLHENGNAKYNYKNKVVTAIGF